MINIILYNIWASHFFLNTDIVGYLLNSCYQNKCLEFQKLIQFLPSAILTFQTAMNPELSQS